MITATYQNHQVIVEDTYPTKDGMMAKCLFTDGYTVSVFMNSGWEQSNESHIPALSLHDIHVVDETEWQAAQDLNAWMQETQDMRAGY